MGLFQSWFISEQGNIVNYSLSDFFKWEFVCDCECECASLVLQAGWPRGLGYINIDLATAAEFTDSQQKQVGSFLQKYIFIKKGLYDSNSLLHWRSSDWHLYRTNDDWLHVFIKPGFVCGEEESEQSGRRENILPRTRLHHQPVVQRVITAVTLWTNTVIFSFSINEPHRLQPESFSQLSSELWPWYRLHSEIRAERNFRSTSVSSVIDLRAGRSCSELHYVV